VKVCSGQRNNGSSGPVDHGIATVHRGI